jgi:hypothetical protein
LQIGRQERKKNREGEMMERKTESKEGGKDAREDGQKKTENVYFSVTV